MSGWLRRGRIADLPRLPEVPPVRDLPTARLQSGARYLATTLAGAPESRVTGRGLGSRGSCRLSLSGVGLDVIRLAGSFRIPVEALRGARHADSLGRRSVPPHGLLVVSWSHGDYVLDTGFRLTAPTPVPGSAPSVVTPEKAAKERHTTWVRTISKLARENAA